MRRRTGLLGTLARVALAATALGWLVGCAGLTTVAPEQALLERAQRYWTARESGDLHTVFDLESGAREGWLDQMGAAAIGSGLMVRNVRVAEPRVEGEQGEVTVTADVKIMFFTTTKGVFHQTVKDRWVRLDGQWFHKTHKWKSLGALAAERQRRQNSEASQPDGSSSEPIAPAPEIPAGAEPGR